MLLHEVYINIKSRIAWVCFCASWDG